MTLENIDVSIYEVLKNIKLISPEAISGKNWQLAYALTHNIDEDDTPFVATTLGVQGALWTGDKKLMNGLKSEGFKDVFSTTQLTELLKISFNL